MRKRVWCGRQACSWSSRIRNANSGLRLKVMFWSIHHKRKSSSLLYKYECLLFSLCRIPPIFLIYFLDTTGLLCFWLSIGLIFLLFCLHRLAYPCLKMSFLVLSLLSKHISSLHERPPSDKGTKHAKHLLRSHLSGAAKMQTSAAPPVLSPPRLPTRLRGKAPPHARWEYSPFSTSSPLPPRGSRTPEVLTFYLSCLGGRVRFLF